MIKYLLSIWKYFFKNTFLFNYSQITKNRKIYKEENKGKILWGNIV